MPKLIFFVDLSFEIHQTSYPRWPRIFEPDFGWFGANSSSGGAKLVKITSIFCNGCQEEVLKQRHTLKHRHQSVTLTQKRFIKICQYIQSKSIRKIIGGSAGLMSTLRMAQNFCYSYQDRNIQKSFEILYGRFAVQTTPGYTIFYKINRSKNLVNPR